MQHGQNSAVDDSMGEWDFDDWDEGLYAADGNRGLTHGYARSTVETSRALVVGCNYPKEREYRLRGACRDARDWAKALRERLGVPESKLTVLTDEDEDGKEVSSSSGSFPSQRAILDALEWLTDGAQPGDALIFVFCGRGTDIPDVDLADLSGSEVDFEDDEYSVEEGLLAGDFRSVDRVRGYSMRMVTDELMHRCLAELPKGVCVTLVLDACHGSGMLPVTKRLDGRNRGPEVGFGKMAAALGAPPGSGGLAPLCHGVWRTLGDVKRGAREPGVSSTTKARPRNLQQGDWPTKLWLRGAMFWEGTQSGQARAMDGEVLAFALTACGPAGCGFELNVPEEKYGAAGPPP